MKYLVVLLLCLSLTGCASTSTLRTEKQQCEEILAQKQGELEELKQKLEEKNISLKKNEARIAEMTKKLEGFGVFD